MKRNQGVTITIIYVVQKDTNLYRRDVDESTQEREGKKMKIAIHAW